LYLEELGDRGDVNIALGLPMRLPMTQAVKHVSQKDANSTKKGIGIVERTTAAAG